jgi:hypothetical protein
LKGKGCVATFGFELMAQRFGAKDVL